MNKDRADSAAFSELSHELLASGIDFRFHANGRSMMPTIQDGEILQVRSTTRERPIVGDIILFRKDGRLRAHRIVRRSKGFFLTRGDSGVDPDGIVSREQIIGKVLAKECRRTGRLVPLSGTVARITFFWRESKRLLRRSETSLATERQGVSD